MRTAWLVLLAASACTLYPDVSPYRPKAPSDCAAVGKACGYRCVEVDDPAAGCTLDACAACPAGAAGTVPVCLGIGQCGIACADGHVAIGGDPRNGCAAASLTDPGSCGSAGHACQDGEACTGGLCTAATAWAAIGKDPRGLALVPDGVAWANDLQGGLPVGTLSWRVGAAPAVTATDFGHPTWVRSHGSTVVAAATDAQDDTQMYLGVVDASAGTAAVDWAHGGNGGVFTTGLAVTEGWLLYAVTWDHRSSSGASQVDYESLDPANPDVFGMFDYSAVDVTGLGEGGGLYWVGWTHGVHRLVETGLPADANSGFDSIGNGGLDFTGLPREPRAHRLAARTGSAGGGTAEVYFADLSDGSIWVGLAGSGTLPYRLVHGDGPRSQMDLVSDADAVFWSDLDRGEIWEYRPDGGNPPFLLARGKPWALALDAARVYWTDVDAQAIRSVAR